MKKADVLREYSGKKKFSDENAFLILSGEIGRKPAPNRTPTVKVSKNVYARYFKPGQPAKEIREIVESALALYFKSQQ